jgi:YcaO-like protein with predicted kinase domain
MNSIFDPRTRAQYREALLPAFQNGQLFEFEFSPLDHLNIPLWTVALIGENGALSDGFGYGPNLPYAQTSAYGETLEWFWTRQALKTAPRRWGTFAQMSREVACLNPISCNLEAGSDYSPDLTELEWVEVTRHPGGEKRWIPIEFVAPRAADIFLSGRKRPLLSVPITNGSGAGPTFEHALAHGILELLQRDGNSVSYRAMDRGIKIELDDVQDGQTRELLAFLESQNIEVIAKLAALDFGMANVYVVGYDRDPSKALSPISLSACGEAVHPDREFALAKALREFVMARSRKAFNHGLLAPVRAIAPPGYLESFRPSSMRSEDDRALREMQGWMNLSHAEFFEMLRDPVFETCETVRFSELPHTSVASAQARLDVLTQRLNAQELEIYYFDATPENCPVHVLKTVVPSLEVETMTYERIGKRNLKRLLERDSPIVGQGEAPPSAKPIRLVGNDDKRFWFDSQKKEDIIGKLYPLYREPGRHVIGFLETV